MLHQNSNIYRASSFSHSVFFLSLLLILSSCILHSPVERPINSMYKWIVTLIVQKEAAARSMITTRRLCIRSWWWWSGNRKSSRTSCCQFVQQRIVELRTLLSTYIGLTLCNIEWQDVNENILITPNKTREWRFLELFFFISGKCDIDWRLFAIFQALRYANSRLLRQRICESFSWFTSGCT